MPCNPGGLAARKNAKENAMPLNRTEENRVTLEFTTNPEYFEKNGTAWTRYLSKCGGYRVSLAEHLLAKEVPDSNGGTKDASLSDHWYAEWRRPDNGWSMISDTKFQKRETAEAACQAHAKLSPNPKTGDDEMAKKKPAAKKPATTRALKNVKASAAAKKEAAKRESAKAKKKPATKAAKKKAAPKSTSGKAPTARPAKKTTKKVPVAKKASGGAKPKDKLSQLDAAAKVLSESKSPLNCQAMVAAMADKGYWSSPGGKTPHATLYAAILREISKKGREARFRKVDKGTFDLNAAA